MKRIAALLLLVAFPGCGNTPTSLTEPGDGTLGSTALDSDGDGCSDFDELNISGSCDNNPNTSFCQTTYYNTRFRFGFDPPLNAEQEITNNEGNIVFSSWWPFMFEGRVLDVGVIIVEDPGVSLADWVAINIENELALFGEQLLDEFPFVLANGTNAYFWSITRSVGSPTVYMVDVIANGYAYRVNGAFPEGALTEASHDFMIAILDSLCID